jgi:hypothetical protein
MARQSKYLTLKNIIDKTYLEVYKIPIAFHARNFQQIKDAYNFLSKATNIDMEDFVRFSMENWVVIMSKVASTSTREQECMKTFHIGYFTAALEQFLVIYADRKDLIGYIAGDFRHNEVVDLVRKGLSKEDAEKKVEAKYNPEKPKANPLEVEKLIKENAKLKEQMSNLLASMQNRQAKDKEEMDRLTTEIRELKDVVQKYRTGQLLPNFKRIDYSLPQVGDSPSMIGRNMYPNLENISNNLIAAWKKSEDSADIFSNWHEADEARREEIRKTRQYITQHEMYEGFWSLLDSSKEEASS